MQGETLSGNSATRKPRRSGFCKCGAWLGALGLEPTPELFVEHIVEVFREVRRVLRNDGTCWVNLGSSYQNKQELGIPWRVAFALQADGWYLRSDIIWAKPNPMPESVTDRPTKAHEYLFLLSKSERYFYDALAIQEKAIEGTDLGLLRGRSFADGEHVAWHAPSIKKRQDEGVDSRLAGNGTRNRRSVWNISTQAFPESHFAVFPEALVEPCILAGTSEAGCCDAKVTKLRVRRDLTPEQQEKVQAYLQRKGLI